MLNYAFQIVLQTEFVNYTRILSFPTAKNTQLFIHYYYHHQKLESNQSEKTLVHYHVLWHCAV
jgi:spore cortex formation protein SpoVR/YcgB (stage V sporulation)